MRNIHLLVIVCVILLLVATFAQNFSGATISASDITGGGVAVKTVAPLAGQSVDFYLKYLNCNLIGGNDCNVIASKLAGVHTSSVASSPNTTPLAASPPNTTPLATTSKNGIKFISSSGLAIYGPILNGLGQSLGGNSTLCFYYLLNEADAAKTTWNFKPASSLKKDGSDFTYIKYGSNEYYNSTENCNIYGFGGKIIKPDLMIYIYEPKPNLWDNGSKVIVLDTSKNLSWEFISDGTQITQGGKTARFDAPGPYDYNLSDSSNKCLYKLSFKPNKYNVARNDFTVFGVEVCSN
ncbi:MAG: hypothetical protein WCI04_03200 [archaeon]